MVNEQTKLDILQKIKSHRETFYEESQTYETTEIEKIMKKREQLDEEIKTIINSLFPSLVKVINDKTTAYKEDFYFYDVAKMLMNDTYTGLLMTRRNGVQVYCLGTEDEEAHFNYYMETQNYVALHEIENGEVKRKLNHAQALKFYSKIVNQAVRNNEKAN